MRNSWLFALLIPLCVPACSAPAARGDQPALLAEPDTQVREELRQVISAAMYGVPVTLAEDALTRESLLIVEPARPRDGQQHPLQGRQQGAPEKFRLLLSDGDCYLLQLSSGRRWKLSATCVPEN